ncbi:MAG: heavy metal-responsive transcriptional regulator [Anaerolineales bacterium]|nr:heavy metal-responsive transcriptional regulator [Anaerolineales bacterium]
MHIGELAKRSGLSEKTIRYYESIGILPPPQRGSNGYREFDEQNLERARFAAGARSLGFSLDDITEILAMQHRGETPCRTVLNLIEQKANQIAEHVRLLQQMEKELRQLYKLASNFPIEDIDGKDCICHLVKEQKAG